MRPVNLQTLSKEDFKKFLDSFDHVFSDCDGVIWSRQPFPGVAEFYKLLENMGKTVNFLSNNSIRSEEMYTTSFQNAGIDRGYERLTVPCMAIAEHLKSINFNKTVYCVSCEQNIKTLEKAGFKCKYGPEQCYDYYGDFVNYLEDDPEIGAVVFDSDFKVNMAKMYKAITYLRNPDVLFIDGASDKHVPLKKGCLTLGVSVFTDLVAKEVNRTPTYLCKPSRAIGEMVMRRSGVTDPSKVLFIGDMIDQDIKLAQNMGFKSLLVLTSFNEEYMMSRSDILPDYYADSVGALLPQLKSLA